MIKLIDSSGYHVWTDALHARQLARDTTSDWDRGAYVRWTIQTAWSAFENFSQEALQADKLGIRFKDKFDEAVKNKGLPPVKWGDGLWQQVLKVYRVRNKFTHAVPSISHSKLLLPVEAADNAISVLRDGITAVANLVGLTPPLWIEDDEDRGWKGNKRGVSAGAEFNALAIYSDADEDDPNTVRITVVDRYGQEHVTDIHPPGTDHSSLLESLIPRLSGSATAVRAYRGAELLKERKLTARD